MNHLQDKGYININVTTECLYKLHKYLFKIEYKIDKKIFYKVNCAADLYKLWGYL